MEQPKRTSILEEKRETGELFDYMRDIWGSGAWAYSTSVMTSGKSLSDLLQYTPEQLVSEFHMAPQHASEFVNKAHTAKKPRLDDDEQHDVAKRPMQNLQMKSAREIFDHMQDIWGEDTIYGEYVGSVWRSGKPLSDLLQYTPHQLVSEFHMALQYATEFLSKGRTAKKPCHENEQRDVVERALAHKCFQVPFLGAAHQELHNQLVKHRVKIRPETHYSPYCTLVQSSGVGKSRALMELSKLDVYICYCSLASDSTVASPPRTGGLADKLVNTFSQHGMGLYLRAWLHVLTAHISTMSAEDWKQQQLPKEDGSPYGDLAEKVLREWTKSETEYPYKGEDPEAWNMKTCSKVIRSVKNALQKKCTHAPCSVIFAFDEARGLQIRAPQSNSFISSPFYQIRMALRIFFDHRTFIGIMLDTSAKVTNLLPSKHNEDSQRAISMGFQLAHPIYFLPNISLFKTPASQRVPHCFRPEQWLKQGRPMWSARLQKDSDPYKVRMFALQKLVRTVAGTFEEGVPVDVLRGVMTESQAMALLSATAGLSICARSELAKVMSASHMNLVLRVSKDRSRIYIGLPAEPILAEGAASALRDEVVQEGALQHLLAACRVGYVTPGPRGESVAKFILVAAMWDKNIEWQLRRIPVEEYLEKLLVNGDDDRITFDRVKAKCPARGAIFFNSFVLARKPPTTVTLRRAFVSGYALMYRAENTLPGVDMIIPVWTAKGMTCIVVSVKNLKRSGWLEKVSTDKVRSEFTNVEVKPGLVCITIVMSLCEPAMQDRWVLWESNQGHVADPYINLTCYGIDRNYNYLTEKVKELLKEVLITVPDERAGATDEEKEWIQGLLPEQYI